MKRYEPNTKYLAYWGVISKWACKNWNLKRADLELLWYLSVNGSFEVNDFREGTLIYYWKKDRFYRLIHEGWISKLTEPSKLDRRNGERMRYCVSSKTRRVIKRIDKILQGYEEIPESVRRNRLMKKNLPYAEKNLKKAILKLNKRRQKINPFDKLL